MTASDLLSRAYDLGATFTVPEPGRVHVSAPEPLPDNLMAELRRYKAEVIELLSSLPADACFCNPLPSQKEYGYMAQAGCGPGYKRCDACGYTWRCSMCGGCRQCRTPD